MPIRQQQFIRPMMQNPAVEQSGQGMFSLPTYIGMIIGAVFIILVMLIFPGIIDHKFGKSLFFYLYLFGFAILGGFVGMLIAKIRKNHANQDNPAFQGNRMQGQVY